MRMWNVDPKVMCRKHLLGEHVEMHMFVGTIIKGVSLHGYVAGGLVQTQDIEKRHWELVAEMERRGMNHKSPLPNSLKVALTPPQGEVNSAANLIELARRCPECAKLQKEHHEH